METATREPILIVEEINKILEGDASADERFQALVSYLKKAMGVDVCSLFRLHRRKGMLYLESTDGLSREIVGQPILKKTEGLTGLVARTQKPLAVRDGPSHPAFRYVPGLREEIFHSYLGVPIVSGKRVIGVLVVQTARPRDFTREDIALMNAIARGISPVAAREFRKRDLPADKAREKDKPKTAPSKKGEASHTLRGVMLSPGCFIGPPRPLDHSLKLETLKTPESEGSRAEAEKLRQATRRVWQELESEAQSLSGSEGHAVLMAHKVVLRDKELAAEVLNHVRSGRSAADAIRRTALRWIRLLEGARNPALKARALDLRDIAFRFLRALGIQAQTPAPPREKFTAVARTVLPGDVLRLGEKRLGAIIATDQGASSHTAILARAYGIPAVQIAPVHFNRLLNAGRLLVDGAEGIVVIEPSAEECELYTRRAQQLAALPEGGPTDLKSPAETPDGLKIRVGMNAGLLAGMQHAEGANPDDIGLYRTEFAFMQDAKLPGLKAQTNHYRKALELAGGRTICFRTFDFGGEKFTASLDIDPEQNPMMGFRSTRLMLGHPTIFRMQLKALLQASAQGPISIMFPMISTAEEFNLALDELNAVKNELDRTGAPYERNIPVGIMLETPSVLFLIDELAQAAEFFAIGTNDLIQYLMAADRSNAKVSRLLRWHHPAVLGALDHLQRQSRRNERPVRICGEMANHPWAALVLVGLGYEHLSIDYHSIPLIRWTLRQTSAQSMRKLAQAVLQAATSNEVIEIFFNALEDFRREAPPLGKLLAASLDNLRMNSIQF